MSDPPDPPLKCTPAHKLKLVQTQACDALAKCMPLLYCTEDLEVLQQVTKSAEELYCKLTMSANAQQDSTKLPHFPSLNKVALKRAKESCKQLSRMSTRENRKRKTATRSEVLPKKAKLDELASIADNLHNARRGLQKKQPKLPPKCRQLSEPTQVAKIAHRLLVKGESISKMKQVYYIIYTLYAARMQLNKRKARFPATSALPSTSDANKSVGTPPKVLVM